jgi:hypothetical protein
LTITGTDSNSKINTKWNKKKARREVRGNKQLKLQVVAEDKDLSKKTQYSTKKRLSNFLRIKKVHHINHNLKRRNHNWMKTLKEVKDMKKSIRNIKSKSIKRTNTNTERKKSKKKMNTFNLRKNQKRKMLKIITIKKTKSS